MKRVLLFLLGVAVSVGCFAFVLRDIKLQELKASFVHADYRTLPLMLGLLFAFYWLKAIRWKWLLTPVLQVSTGKLFQPLLIGFAANNILPAHLGEFVRVFVLRRKYGVPAAAVLSTVVLERIFDVLAILILFGIGLMYSGDLPENYRNSAILIGSVALIGVVSVVVYLIWTEWYLRVLTKVLNWLPFLPASLTEKIVGMFRSGASGLAALKSATRVSGIAITSIAQWFLNGLIAYVALKSFGIPVTPATGLVVTGVTAFGVTVPSTPGYFGVIQLCFEVSMKSQESIAQIPGIDSLVLGASMYYQLSMYIPVTALGLYFLNRTGLHLGDLQKEAEKTPSSASSDSEPQADSSATA